MFSVPRFIGGLAAAGLSALAAMPTAQAAGNVAYTDSLCTAYYTDPLSPPPTQVLKCARMVCSITGVGSYITTVGQQHILTVACQNPPAASYKWVLSPQSPAGCPPPGPSDTGITIQIVSNTPRVCWYEAITHDANNANTGWVRYGVVWQ